MRAVPAPHAVFLSGGVDSIAVAAAAADIAAREGTTAPIALSLVFPDPASNEEAIQAAAARRLGLSQHLVPFAEAAGPGGLLASALELTASWPQPMLNLWAPAYMHLARLGRRRRCAADFYRPGRRRVVDRDAVRAGRLRGAWQRPGGLAHAGSVAARAPRGPAASCRGCCGRPRAGRSRVPRSTRRAPIVERAPPSAAARGTTRVGGARPGRPCGDGRARRPVDGGRAAAQGFYVREMRTALFHPGITHDMEETQEFGRRNGQRVLHPFWDVD